MPGNSVILATRGWSMKRWHLIAGLIVFTLAAVLIMCLVPRSGPTPSNVAKIKKGMSPAEVNAILGPPTTEQWFPDDHPDESRATWWTLATWEPEDGYVLVVFYGGRVDQVDSLFAPSPWQRLARHLGLGP